MNKLLLTTTVTTLVNSQSQDLFGTEKTAPSNPIMDLGRNIASTRNMIHELAEQTENPIGVFTLDNDEHISGTKVYPRWLIRRHGCWCSYEGCDGEDHCTQGVAPRVKDFWGMPHKTALDSNCHKMFNAHKCLAREIPGCTNMRLKYRYKFYSEGNGQIECLAKKNDECQQKLCEIDAEFASELVSMARDNPSEILSWKNNYNYEEDADFEANCPRQPHNPSQYDGGECCGLSLNRSFYKAIPTLQECCVETDGSGNVIAEEVRAIGMCV